MLHTYTEIVIIIHKQDYNLTPYILWIWYIKSSARTDTVIISFEWVVIWMGDDGGGGDGNGGGVVLCGKIEQQNNTQDTRRTHTNP